MLAGADGGPQTANFVVRTGGNDYTSAPVAPSTLTWETMSNNWDQNPATSSAWSTSDLANNSTSYNLGIESHT
jgi:hypothetical protein